MGANKWTEALRVKKGRAANMFGNYLYENT